MLPILNQPDLKEVAKIERYKMVENERRKRIFNAKQRQIGVDFDTLQYQIQEKKEREKAEKIEEMKYLEKQKLDGHVLEQLVKREAEEKRRVGQQIDEYRKRYQKFEDRREFDLNDPNRFKKDIFEPDINDPRFGISSLKRFEGSEDGETSEIRKRILQDQQQSWLLQQMLEKEKAKRDMKLADQIYEEAMKARDDRFFAMKTMEDECKRKLEIATKEYNKAMAVKKLRDEIEEMRINMEDEYTHKINQISSDFLSETKDSRSALNPNRPVTTMFKGLSDDKLKEIRRAQLKQIEEKKAIKRAEELEEHYYYTYQEQIQKSLQIADAIQGKKEIKNGEELRLENKRLMEEHKAKLNYLNNVVYTNRPSPEYFDQFNTSTR
ncbi:RIB43A-like with coiled-coils protein 1 [Cimex lectularius]|uniref:RIB43A-like with coiled-coils protein 2 n=1 Tax=Cimex lectularius TaxID=79782 RepID=A0A8I6SCA8_CIMLE|nr:RIB43A-like with coiled-coils protein 1 [Cimex lectularius]